jgi:hypothetical protein
MSPALEPLGLEFIVARAAEGKLCTLQVIPYLLKTIIKTITNRVAFVGALLSLILLRQRIAGGPYP